MKKEFLGHYFYLYQVFTKKKVQINRKRESVPSNLRVPTKIFCHVVRLVHSIHHRYSLSERETEKRTSNDDKS